ncbi:acyltransferase family protein [Pseudomonas alcaligenes]|uniref:acyltransferase family protein n=1 Tax=Aquipseudomonas alcaligenes TaxID=43263 RepID=UPI00358FB94C
MTPIGYVAGLDGLRALAIVLVLLFHANAPGLPGGNIGVDLFLVLSGFLITSLLLEEWRTCGGIELWRFYMRRAWRLMPALLLMLLLYVVLAPLFWPDYFFHLRDLLIALLYISNLAASVGTLPEKLLHTWSLGLEEQFYLLWPLALLAYLRFLRRPPLWVFLLLLYLGLYAWRVWCLHRPEIVVSLAYYRPDLHAGGLVLGAALGAWWQERSARPVPASLGWLGWLAILVALVAEQTEFMHLLLYIPLAEVGTTFLIMAILSGRQAGFSDKLPVHIGRMSYGLYLFHYPIMLYMVESRQHWLVVISTGGLLAYGLALLSFHSVEAWARRCRERRWSKASVTGC